MARVGSKDTAPELLVRQYLHAAGFRYRLHDKRLPGKPDLVLPKYGAVVFVQGCFWHGHGAACLRRSRKPPVDNAAYWQAKFARNMARDQRDQTALKKAGWRVLMVWECELRKSERGATLHRLTREILAGEKLTLESMEVVSQQDSWY
jgi:DNA mismatch endonuclease (patch repair protein)